MSGQCCSGLSSSKSSDQGFSEWYCLARVMLGMVTSAWVTRPQCWSETWIRMHVQIQSQKQLQILSGGGNLHTMPDHEFGARLLTSDLVPAQTYFPSFYCSHTLYQQIYKDWKQLPKDWRLCSWSSELRNVKSFKQSKYSNLNFTPRKERKSQWI